MLQRGQLGIHPPGALGVAFFVHASADCFIGRGGDGITDSLKEAGTIRLEDHGTFRSVPLADRIFSNLLEADALNRMPEVLFVCCNPNQLGLFTGELTRFLESLAQRGHVRSVDELRQRVPILLIPPNGILAEQTMQTYEEQLRESMLMDRLPGVTEPMLDALLDRVIRGVSLQAGGRRGAGADTVYLLERKGLVVFAGGGELERQRIELVLDAHDYPYQHIRGVPGTRVEFDKAMISIVLNVGGLIHTVRPDGELIDLRMGDLCKDPTKADFVRTITRAVYDIGLAIGAYPPESTYDEIWAPHRATIMAHAGHVTSSLKTLRDALGAGLDSVALFSNEEWLLTPLRRYAANVGLTELEELFKSLHRQVQESMARAIHHRDKAARGTDTGAGAMKLATQRNFSIDLYEAGPDNMVLVGTMLDDEHLIKLEVNVYLPDEQITRTRLDMIRSPFPVCREVEKLADSLVGLRIERGVLGEIVRRVGGRTGCSHIKELATNIVYFAASHLIRKRSGVDPLSIDYIHKPPEERFALTKDLLAGSCLAYCQTTPQGLDEQIGIRRVGDEHKHPLELGEYEPSLGLLLKDRADRWGDKVFIRYRKGDQEVSVTWGEFADRVFRIGQHLTAEGFRAGDRICTLSENRADTFMVEMAVMSMGGVTVPIFAGYPRPQVEFVLGHSKPRYVFASGLHQLEKIDRQRHPRIERYYSMNFDQGCESWGALDAALLTADDGPIGDALDGQLESVRPDDLCMVMYTSGTTGSPKGVKLCHGNLISQQKALSLLWDVGEEDVILNYLPWHHSFGGLFERFLAIYSGCELCLDDSRGRDIDRLIDNWKTFNPTLFFSVPRVHDAVLARCRADSGVGDVIFKGRLRFVFTAGAPLPAHVETVYRAHGIPVLEGWGLRETSPCVTITTKDSSWRSGYVGFPIPGVRVRIDTNQEILVNGPNVMAGYLDDEETTSHVISEDGWFRSGDLGEFTKEGLRIIGRKDRTFKLTNGEKVHPLRIENLLVNESPYISLALVLGSGENFVGALIYPSFSRLQEWAAERGISQDDLLERPEVAELFVGEIERVNSLIEVKYHRVRRAVLADREPTLERGEITPSGKVVRKAVVEHYARKIEGMFASTSASGVIELAKTPTSRNLAHAR